MNPDPHDGQVKIRVPLVGPARESGYESESLWAEPLGDNLYRIWNLPVFVYNLDMRAVVECAPDPEGGLPVAIRVVEPGDCYVVRLYFHDAATDAHIQEVLDVLSSRRALFEKYDRRLWAVGLRTVPDYEWVRQALKRFVDADLVTVESAFQPHMPALGAAPDKTWRLTKRLRAAGAFTLRAFHRGGRT
jgi:hypothetical protein